MIIDIDKTPKSLSPCFLEVQSQVQTQVFWKAVSLGAAGFCDVWFFPLRCGCFASARLLTWLNRSSVRQRSVAHVVQDTRRRRAQMAWCVRWPCAAPAFDLSMSPGLRSLYVDVSMFSVFVHELVRRILFPDKTHKPDEA